MNIGVLASHGGSTLQAIIDATEAGTLNARVALVLSNNSRSGAMGRAEAHAIPRAHISGATHPHPEQHDAAVRDALVNHQVDIVVLAGYMKALGPLTLDAFRQRIINTHPALLPKFGGAGYFGLRVHEAVIAAGESESGATVHWVAAEYDTGPIIAQATVPVLPEDTAEDLQERVKAAEKPLLLDVLRDLCATQARRA